MEDKYYNRRNGRKWKEKDNVWSYCKRSVHLTSLYDELSQREEKKTK